uniref:F-box domain-containing protein n=1 Tax=Adineta vaga TaxID=104782 RepID=B3G4C2_ADIVA|nr:unknown [Adineta vaga]
MLTKLESFSNELFLDFFEYLNVGEILYSFHLLNSRLNHLIYGHLRTIRHLDLRSMSLDHFNPCIQSEISKIVNQIASLTLSNHESPLQSEFFRSNHFRFDQFPTFEESRIEAFEILLENLSNLRHLTVESLSMFANGYQWEVIITKRLPNLKTFRCSMGLHIRAAWNIEKRLYTHMRSFQSRFWIEDRRWFIRCYLKTDHEGERSILYHTLPYTFTRPILQRDYIWYGSTSPYEKDFYGNNSIHISSMNTLTSKQLKKNHQIILQRLTSFCERVRGIFKFNINISSSNRKDSIPRSMDTRELSVELPFNQYFWASLPKLHQIVSLSIVLFSDDTDQSDLQLLLNQMPHLFSKINFKICFH